MWTSVQNFEEHTPHRLHTGRRHRDRASWRRADRRGLGAALADDAAGSSVRFPSNLSLEMVWMVYDSGNDCPKKEVF